MNYFLTIVCFIIGTQSIAQSFSTEPVFPTADQPLTLSVNASGTSLEGYSGDVWIWAWLADCSTDCDAPTNVNPATSNEDNAKMTRSGSDPDVYEITFTPTTFFGKEADIITKIGFKLKSVDWSDNIQTDIDLFIDLSSGDLEVAFLEPSSENLLVNTNDVLQISAESSQVVALSLSIGGVNVSSTNGTSISYNHTVTETSGRTDVTIIADDGTNKVQDTFSYIIRSQTTIEMRPTGIQDGMNYDLNDHTKVTLSLLAPEKKSAYVVGDFTNWKIDPSYQMKLDGEHFWIEVTDLTPGQEYGFQYWIDEQLWIADPFCDKVLDPDDQWISSETYPDLMSYPSEALHDKWEFNRVSVLQTNQTSYNWSTTNFEKPKKEDLIIYELLVRDFLGEDNMNYQALIDTLDYIKNLGVNAIELMPIMEFNGNDSWGYNPTHMFAVDKAYGTKNDLKEFIDKAHEKGMAVILDMVMNQNNKPAPYLIMDFDFANDRPNSTNKWFNVEARHPFNVFYDINHESTYTQAWLDSINHYWLNEFRFDGFRFDLSKGFTQVSNTDVGLWSNYDISRINILKRMADKIWSHTPDAYVILEHFADNTEEKGLSDYGMLLWGNAHGDYKEANIGRADDGSISWTYFKTRGWINNYLISYMESHDEQRQLYDMKQLGRSTESYDIKDISTALNRLKMSSAFFYTIPGPKMLWQFGEFGYDVSIDQNGRTGRKPTKWEYLENPERNKLLKVNQELIGLRNRYDVFTRGDFSWSPDGDLKSIHLSKEDTAVVIIGNFGLTDDEIDPEFTETGTWYNFFMNEEIEVTNLATPIPLKPGEFHIYTNKKLHTPEADLIDVVVTTSIEDSQEKTVSLYPNPSQNEVYIKVNEGYEIRTIELLNLFGERQSINLIKENKNTYKLGLRGLPNGLYFMNMSNGRDSCSKKLVKN